MTSDYEQWQASVDDIGRRLTDVETRLNQAHGGDPDTTAVRLILIVIILLRLLLLSPRKLLRGIM